MQEHLKPTPENINKDKLPQIEKEFSFNVLAPKDSGIPDFVNHYTIKLNEKIEEEVIGFINHAISDSGFNLEHEIVINKNFVIDAITKATARKPLKDSSTILYCPNCCDHLIPKHSPNYCRLCGQKIDWSDEDE